MTIRHTLLMDDIKETLKKNTAVLDPYAAMLPVLVDISAKVNVNPGLLLAGIGGIVGIVLMVLQGWAILVTSLTVFYPMIFSIRAIESEGEDDDKQWLTYWMVFGCCNVIETFFGFILRNTIPYWELVRLLFFVWLLLPQTNGAKVMFESVISPQLEKNKHLIEKWISMTTSAASDAQKNAME